MARCDAAAGVLLLCSALAAAVEPIRAELLAAATLAACLWLGWDALADDRSGPRARLVMAASLIMLAALPALLLAFDRRLWIAPPRLHGLDAGLVLWSIGIASIAAGSRLAGLLARRRGGPGRAMAGRPTTPEPAEPRGRRSIVIVAVIAIVALAAFVHEVGGPLAYFRNLNNSAAANAGLTYLIWGISFVKYAAFAYAGESWVSGAGTSRRQAGAVALAFVLLLFLGSRLLVLVALIQLLLLYALLRPMGPRFKTALLAAAVAGAIVFLGLGEFRRWENLSSPRPSFPSYFVHTSLPSLPRTYVNNYVDTVRLSVLARMVVPRQAPYEDGKELLRVLLQPIPGSLRPTIATAPALLRTFTSGHRNGNALPVPVEGYIEFGFAGVVVFGLLLGLLVGLLDGFGAAFSRDVGRLATGIAAGTGLVIVFRGSLHNGIAIAGIDVIGFFLVHRLLFRPVASPANEQPPAAPISATAGPQLTPAP